ncbi:MAG: PD-(D/E)XK nuclease family protein, partial [Oscillospiraceae bacterium]|nr:PD-(D/E)XK nuclease family protein [Oscillospiraceae bacterium]
MLIPVFARSGSDKRKFITDKISALLSSSQRKVMLIVPEQSSFETEKELYLSLGDRDYARIEVLSFTRLISLVRAHFGGKNAERLSNAGKLILSSCAAEKAAPQLKLYAGQAGSSAFAEKISSIIDELKVAGFSAKSFEAAASKVSQNEQLSKKLSDISTLYSYYDALLSKNYLDPSDELFDAAQSVGTGEFFRNYDIIIDEFASFNGSQYAMMAKMMENSPSMTVILCAKQSERGRCPKAFRTPLDTLNKLKSTAQRAGCDVAQAQTLPAGEKYSSESLRSLEKFAAGERDFEEISDQNVTVSIAHSAKEECRHIAAHIRRLVSENGMRYRDVAVIGRDMGEYLSHLEDSFKLYDIPFFSDSRASLSTRPMVIFIINLLEVLISDIDPARLISYLKCAVSPLSADEAVELENYIDLWKLTKKELKADFDKNPDGLDGDPDIKALERLNYLNELRKKAVMPLFALKKEVSDCDGRELTRAIYRFMQQNLVLSKLSEYTNDIFETDSALAAEQYRAYQVSMNVMSQLSHLLEGEKVSLKRYLELFRLALSAEDVGSIPHHLDEVQIGDAGRIRTGDARAVFLVGMNEGLFPKRHSEDGLFTDDDRRAVRTAGIDILTPSGVMNQNESYYLYTSLTCASEQVHISLSRTSQSGEMLLPSKIVKQICEKLGVTAISLEKSDKTALFGTDEAAFELLCSEYHNNTAFANSLREYFMTMPDSTYRTRLLNIDKGLRLRTSSIGNEAAQRLYGKEMMISHSQIERYHRCRFSHFCHYGLALRALKPAEITLFDSGNAIHEVLERLLRDYSKEEIVLFTEDELSLKVEELLYEFLSVRIGESAMRDNRIRYSIMRLKSTIVPVVGFVIKELSGSGFVPRDFELKIQKGKDIEPYRITSEDGSSIGVYGNVDRVDIKEQNGKTYVRVIDYKSGGKVFKKEELSYGLNLQMFLYLFAIWENGSSRYSGDITPSGILYMPAKRPDYKKKGGESIDKIRSEQDKKFKMSGFILDDEAVKTPDTKKYLNAASDDLSEFSAIKNQTEKLLCSMADSLKLGELSINPIYVDNKNVGCKNCDYRMICGFEEGDPHRSVG